jgi:hypothetical protein
MTQARRALAAAKPELRDQVAAALIAQAGDDRDAAAIHALGHDMAATDSQAAADDMARQVSEALASQPPAPTTEPEAVGTGPYVDEDGRLRTAGGMALDDPEAAADAFRALAMTNHNAANELLDRLETTDPTMAATVVEHLGGH